MPLRNILRVFSVAAFDSHFLTYNFRVVDKLLKEHLKAHFGVKQRTLQAWLRAGLIPGTTRTKGGHYRVRAPRGMTADRYHAALASFVGAGGSSSKELLRRAAAAAVPDSWWDWLAAVTANVKTYNTAMRQVRRVCRGQGGVPFFRLDDMVAASKRRAGLPAKRRKATSSASSSSAPAPAGVPASAPAQ